MRALRSAGASRTASRVLLGEANASALVQLGRMCDSQQSTLFSQAYCSMLPRRILRAIVSPVGHCSLIAPARQLWHDLSVRSM